MEVVNYFCQIVQEKKQGQKKKKIKIVYYLGHRDNIYSPI